MVPVRPRRLPHLHLCWVISGNPEAIRKVTDVVLGPHAVCDLRLVDRRELHVFGQDGRPALRRRLSFIGRCIVVICDPLLLQSLPRARHIGPIQGCAVFFARREEIVYRFLTVRRQSSLGRTNKEKHVIAGGIGSGMRPMEMHVYGAGAMQAIRHCVSTKVSRLSARTGKGNVTAAVATVKRVDEMLSIDQVLKLYLDQVAHPGPKCRARNRITLGKKRVFRNRLQQTASMKIPHVLSGTARRAPGIPHHALVVIA